MSRKRCAIDGDCAETQSDTPRCIYDELFSLDSREVQGTIERLFDRFYAFSMRHYGMFVSEADTNRLMMMAERGNHGLKLAFILFIIAHETAIRTNICSSMLKVLEEEQGSLDGIEAKIKASIAEAPQRGATETDWFKPASSLSKMETICKTVGFYRSLAIGMRSILETQFTEVNAPVLVDRFIQLMFICWKCTDAEAMQNMCDTFACRKRIPGMGVFAHWARDPLWDGFGTQREASRYDLVNDPDELVRLCGRRDVKASTPTNENGGRTSSPARCKSIPLGTVLSSLRGRILPSPSPTESIESENTGGDITLEWLESHSLAAAFDSHSYDYNVDDHNQST